MENSAAGVPEDLAARGVSLRELEVLVRLENATSTRDIASELFLSPKTVERHIANLAKKLDVGGRAGLIEFASSRVARVPVDPV